MDREPDRHEAGTFVRAQIFNLYVGTKRLVDEAGHLVWTERPDICKEALRFLLLQWAVTVTSPDRYYASLNDCMTSEFGKHFGKTRQTVRAQWEGDKCMSVSTEPLQFGCSDCSICAPKKKSGSGTCTGGLSQMPYLDAAVAGHPPILSHNGDQGQKIGPSCTVHSLLLNKAIRWKNPAFVQLYSIRQSLERFRNDAKNRQRLQTMIAQYQLDAKCFERPSDPRFPDLPSRTTPKKASTERSMLLE